MLLHMDRAPLLSWEESDVSSLSPGLVLVGTP